MIENSARLFVAIDMPEVVIDEIARLEHHMIKQQLFEGAWVNPSHAHCTLSFIGNIPCDQISLIDAALKTVNFSSMKAQLSGLDFFMQGPHIKIVYLNFICEQLTSLVQDINQVLAPWVKIEKRPWVNHVTLLRVRKVLHAQELIYYMESEKIVPIEFIINCFALKQSVLSKQGALHTTLYYYSCIKDKKMHDIISAL
jgi:2'-5' RNA ligase